MTEQKLYKIIEQASNGWFLVDTNLTKEQCNEKLNQVIAAGANPNDLKAVFVDDTRYPT